MPVMSLLQAWWNNFDQILFWRFIHRSVGNSLEFQTGTIHLALQVRT